MEREISLHHLPYLSHCTLWCIWCTILCLLYSGVEFCAARLGTSTFVLLSAEQLCTHGLLVFNLTGCPPLPVLPGLVFELHTNLQRALSEVGAHMQSFFFGNA